MDSTMLQENVTQESIRKENMRNCVRIFMACSSMVLGLGLIGGTTTYMAHSYQTKDYVPAVSVTLVVVVAFIWILMGTYYSRTPLEEYPCRFLCPPVTSQTPMRDPLIYNAEDACSDRDEDIAEM